MAYSVPIHEDYTLWTQEVEMVNLKIKEQDGLHKQSQQPNKNKIVISDRNAKKPVSVNSPDVVGKRKRLPTQVLGSSSDFHPFCRP